MDPRISRGIKELPRKVSKLIEAVGKSWELSSIENWLTEEQKHAIMKIPLIFVLKRIDWFEHMLGRECTLLNLALPCLVEGDLCLVVIHPILYRWIKKIWHEIWGIDIPNKMKIFLWKAC